MSKNAKPYQKLKARAELKAGVTHPQFTAHDDVKKRNARFRAWLGEYIILSLGVFQRVCISPLLPSYKLFLLLDHFC